MKLQINKAPPVVQPPNTFTLTGTLEELSAIKTFADYYAALAASGCPAVARRFCNSITQVDTYKWNDSSKLFLPE